MPLSARWKRAAEAVKKVTSFRVVDTFRAIKAFRALHKHCSPEELEELVRQTLPSRANRWTLPEPVAAESIFGEEYHDGELDAILRLVPQPLQRRALVQESPSVHSERASIEEEPFCIFPTPPLPLPWSHLSVHLQSQPPPRQLVSPWSQPPSSLQTKSPPNQSTTPQSREPSRPQTSPPPRQTTSLLPQRTNSERSSRSWKSQTSSLRRHLRGDFSERDRSSSNQNKDKPLPDLPYQPIVPLEGMKGSMRRWAVNFDAEQVATSLWAQETEEILEKRAADVAAGLDFETLLPQLKFRSRGLDPELEGLANGLRPRAATPNGVDSGLSFAERMESSLKHPGTAHSKASQGSGLRRMNAMRNLRERLSPFERRGTD